MSEGNREISLNFPSGKEIGKIPYVRSGKEIGLI
jgi:hypothetical protein